MTHTFIVGDNYGEYSTLPGHLDPRPKPRSVPPVQNHRYFKKSPRRQHKQQKTKATGSQTQNWTTRPRCNTQASFKKNTRRTKFTREFQASEGKTGLDLPLKWSEIIFLLLNITIKSTVEQKKFADYKADGHLWVTLSSGEYYPDILPLACELYKPVLIIFADLLKKAHSATDLMMSISLVKEQWIRIQLSRVFRKYVSPETPVEMLKKKTAAASICEQFGAGFREITEVQRRFSERPIPDEALCAILWEYKDRGKKGYDLTERLFAILKSQFPTLTVRGPERAGKDILLGTVFPDYPKPDRPVDFIIYDGDEVLAVGLARYDSDRGGAQEDDRPGQYRDCAQEILHHATKLGHPTKVIFLNDGPGLLLGSMWNDYAYLEHIWNDRVRVVTLRMIETRISEDWLKS